MTNPLPRLLLTALVGGLTLSPHAARAGVLAATDFSATLPPEIVADGTDAVNATQARTNDGTIDTYQGKRGPALTLSADFTKAGRDARAGLVTPRFAVANTETDLAKLTLGFDLWTSVARPVRVVLQSLNAAGTVTGTRTALVVPPVVGAFYRFGIDLDQTQPGEGKFDPTAPRIQFRFELRDADDATPVPRVAGHVLRVDNLSLTAPAFYVGERGDDAADGRTARTPFATIQRAVDVAQPGDVILVMDGTYTGADMARQVEIRQRGRPERWIVLRAHPGHRPVLTGNGWDVITLYPDCAYVELRGLLVRGQRDRYKLEDALADPQSDRFPDCRFNTNGISLDARKGQEDGGKAHHIRFIGCTVENMPGGGFAAIAGDHVTLEGNQSIGNCHLMRYAGSGISVFRAWDFDTDTGYKNFVIGNRTHGNRCFVPWPVVKRISDGNGIIIDDFINYQPSASNIPYKGRTLVQNNLSFGNGGSGIHAYAANHVDIVNNTAYHNAQSPELVWRQIFAGGKCNDVRVVNNVLHAQRGRPIDLSLPKNSTGVLYSHNVVFGDGDNNVQAGGGLGTDPGAASSGNDQGGNVFADPQFVRATLDAATADFRLGAGSPGLDAGTTEFPLIPRVDLDGRPRPQGAAPDIGAYEFKPVN